VPIRLKRFSFSTQLASAIDAVFDQFLEAEFSENDRKMVVDTSEPNKRRTRKPIQAAGEVVEMCGFEPQTPYMRSKDEAEDGLEKKAIIRRKKP